MTRSHSDLLAADHDLDGIPRDTVPERSVVICTTPGARGDLVAAALRRYGAGVPMEYFDIDDVAAPLTRRWGVIDLDDYIAALHHHRTAATGVFGLVLQWRHVRRLHRRVSGITQLTAGRVLGIVNALAPSPAFVFVRDAEPDRQAVHLHAAHAGDDVYDQRAIAERLALLDATQRCWLEFFDHTDSDVLEVTVDDGFATDPPVERFAAALDLRLQPDAGETGPHPAAAAPIEHRMVQRFRADRARQDRADDLLV